MNNNQSPFELLPNCVCGKILTYALDANPASCLCSFQLINRHMNDFVEGQYASEAWNIACRQLGTKLTAAGSRQVYKSLLMKAQRASWIIQRAMFRYRIAKTTLDFLTSWTPHMVLKWINPCFICGVRWSENSFGGCEVDTCIFKGFLHNGARHGHYHVKDLHDSRLHACLPCGKNVPERAMGKCGRDTACFHCVSLHRKKIGTVAAKALDALETSDDDSDDSEKERFSRRITTESCNGLNVARQPPGSLWSRRHGTFMSVDGPNPNPNLA